MRRHSFTTTQLINYTDEILHGFYNRDIEPYLHYLSDDFVWIGAFDFQFSTTKQDFLSIVQSELNAIPFQMKDEQYELIARDRDTFILCCRFTLSSILPDASSLQMHTRLTIIWKYIDGALKIIHIHGSNAQDISLTIAAPQPALKKNDEDFIAYIKHSTTQTSSLKKLFRQPSGAHCILPEKDILYLQADGQNTKIYTINDCILVSGILQVHQKALSDNFFRIHKSYLVHISAITTFYRYRVTLCNKIELPIGKERYLDLKARCTQT